jgi:ADP-ribose pyrophosphatase YjhB (NUDIX family)
VTPPRVQRIAAYVVCTDDQDRLLLCRLTQLTNRPGAWTLPGGGVEFGEHPEAAALRELEEETGLTGKLGALVGVSSTTGPVRDEEGATFEMHRIRLLYRADITGGTMRFEVGGSTDRAQWFARQDIDGLDLVEVGILGARLAWV